MPTETGKLRAAVSVQWLPAKAVRVPTEAGLLRAAALNLGFGAVPQHSPQSGPQARKNNDEGMSLE